MISLHFGLAVNLPDICKKIPPGLAPTPLEDISRVAEFLGFSSLPVQLSFEQLWKQAPLPCIIRWQGDRFAVVYRVSRRHVYLSDPSKAQARFPIQDFRRQWTVDTTANVAKWTDVGQVLLLEPGPNFQVKRKPKQPQATPPFWRSVLNDLRRILRQWSNGENLGW